MLLFINFPLEHKFMNKSQPTFNFFFWQGFEKTYQKLSKQEAFCQSNKLVFVFYHKLQFSAIWELAILDKAKNLPQVCKTFTYNTKQILSVAASTQVCFHVYEISLFGDSDVELTLQWAMKYFLLFEFSLSSYLTKGPFSKVGLNI